MTQQMASGKVPAWRTFTLLLKILPERFILATLQLGPGLKQRGHGRLDRTQIFGPKVLSNREEVRGYLGENVTWGQNNSLSLALERNRIGIVGPNEISFVIELWTSQCLNMLDLIFQRALKLPNSKCAKLAVTC